MTLVPLVVQRIAKKVTQTVNESEVRKDFPEITPTATSDFICKKCGNSYQTPDDLAKHKRFEEGKEKGRELARRVDRIDKEQFQ